MLSTIFSAQTFATACVLSLRDSSWTQRWIVEHFSYILGAFYFPLVSQNDLRNVCTVLSLTRFYLRWNYETATDWISCGMSFHTTTLLNIYNKLPELFAYLMKFPLNSWIFPLNAYARACFVSIVNLRCRVSRDAAFILSNPCWQQKRKL